MAVEIKVPSVGESITEGVVSHWLKKDGEMVRAGEPIVELETEKATTEVPSPASGKLSTSIPEGKTVAIGAILGRIEEQEEPTGVTIPSQKEAIKREQTGDGMHTKPPRGDSVPSIAAVTTPRVTDTPRPKTTKEAPLSPAARHLIEETGMRPEEIAGTGRGGRITKQDVLSRVQGEQTKADINGPATQATPQAAVSPIASPASRETRERMSAIRQRIADRLVASQKTTATLTTFNEVDMSAVMALREEFKDRFRQKYGVGLGFMSFFVKATIEALRAFPILNARIDGPDVVSHHYYNIGVAVSTEKGLMVPVLHDADRMSFAQIEQRLAELAQRAREGKISISDLQGGTFTITNGGVFGSLLSTPILNPPQVAILGMHTIQKRPVALKDQVVIRPMMYLALSYDHRLIDGRDAVLFLIRVKECIENPSRMFLEV
jgi:2-oxoglutarate dehydrogenase E2 component (dihydrolipoamide succinyltransferase)